MLSMEETMHPYHNTKQLIPTQIHLNVKNIQRMTTFYNDTLGLFMHEQNTESVILGSHEHAFLVLHHTPDYLSVSNYESHLYHFAILVNEPYQLAHILQHLVSKQYPIDGASDHQISHAVYLTDPEGNGIELAYDRDESYWPRIDSQLLDGQAMIKPFDADLYLHMKYPKDEVWHNHAVLGHVHFHSHDLDATDAFMINTLSYTLTMNLNKQALFYSVHDYHHHLGFNRWGNFRVPLEDNKLGIRKLVFESSNIKEDKTLTDPNGFVFELKKVR